MLSWSSTGILEYVVTLIVITIVFCFFFIDELRKSKTRWTPLIKSQFDRPLTTRFPSEFSLTVPCGLYTEDMLLRNGLHYTVFFTCFITCFITCIPSW